MANLWEHEETVKSLGIDVPAWIDQDISPYDIAAILQGGCESGAYMPAVTYHKALATMGEYGDDILDFLTDYYGSTPIPLETTNMSWAGIAVYYVSSAIECWCRLVESEINDALETKQCA